MPFMMPKQQENKISTNGTATGSFVFPFTPGMNVNTGTVKFRILPQLDENLPMVISVNDFWISCTKGGKPHTQRVFLPSYPEVFDSYVWKNIVEPAKEASKDGKTITPRTQAAFLVFDLTPVFVTDDGVFYPDQERKIRTKKAKVDARAKTLTPSGELLGDAKSLDLVPLNQVRVWNHTLKSAELFQKVFDPDTMQEYLDTVYEPHEITVLYSVDSDGTEWNRDVRTTQDTTPFDQLIPNWNERYKVYDIWSWMQPWPDDALAALHAGQDNEEVIEQYGIEPFPVLRSIAEIKQREQARQSFIQEDDDVPF